MKKDICHDCAGIPTNHKIAYITAAISMIAKPINKPISIISSCVDPIIFKVWNPIIPKIISYLTLNKIGKVFNEPTEKDSARIKCLWEEAKKMGIKMQRFSLFKKNHGSYIARSDKQVICFDSLPRPNAPISQSMLWMDDKHTVRKRFIKIGIPIAKGGVAFSKRKALKIFRSLTKPVITKPNLGSRSRHTSVHINNEKDFLKGFLSAKKLSPWVIVEEELKGMVFRATIINGEIVAVIRREPPYVIGDGKSTIIELTRKINSDPKRDGLIFRKVEIDDNARKELQTQKMDWENIPPKDRIITLGEKVSRENGGSTTDVTDIIHRENIELLEEVYLALKNPLFGVDFIIEDISRSWREQPKSGIIECNCNPFIDLHHFPFSGNPRNVARALWRTTFSIL